MTDTISKLLAGQYKDPDGGPNLDVKVKNIVIEDSLVGSECDLVSKLDFGKNLTLITDVNCFRALGSRVEKALASKFDVQSLVLPGNVHADEDTLNKLLEEMEPKASALIAVGSGTINDLTKATAARKSLPYAVFGTAPSMNGYVSENAAITVKKLKKSIAAKAPVGAFFDLKVMSAAPRRMIQSGLGDSICRSTAQADWLLAHLLYDQPYRSAPFELLAEDEKALFENSAGLMKGDLEVTRRLVRTLILSGFGMTICNGSYPASQGEHLISHYIDMMKPEGFPESFHGEQIAVTAITMAQLHEKFLNMKEVPRVSPCLYTKEILLGHFGRGLGEMCWNEFQHKFLTEEKAAKLNEKLKKDWDSIRAEVEKVFIPAESLYHVMRRVDGPTGPSSMGWDQDFYLEALEHAREIRNRYTFLDLFADGGLID